MPEGSVSRICKQYEFVEWDLFCIGRNEFGFHLDGELNRDG